MTGTINAIFIPDAPADNVGGFMGIKLLPNGKTEIKHYYRKADGTATHKKITIASQRQKDILRAKMDLIEKCEQESSLTADVVTWDELVDAVLKKNGGAGMLWVYKQVREGLKGLVDDSFVKRYHRYINILEADDKSVNTISNHKSVIRRILNYAYETGRIDKLPIRKYDVKQEFRSRVWHTEEERLRFFNTLRTEGSHMYWACVLLERRPIRAGSDLFKLTDENLIRVNGLPVLRFIAKKTKSGNKETYIPLYTKSGEVFEDIIDYFNHGRPPGCRLLFPGRDGKPMGNPKKHFGNMLKKAQIIDFHLHDLKHIATTNMIEEGWTIEQLLGMGAQFSEKMIRKVYWKQNATKALAPSTPEQAPKSAVIL